MAKTAHHFSALTIVIGFGLSPASAQAQTQDFSMKGQYELVKGWVLKGAAAMSEADYSFKPVICTVPAGGKSPLTGDAEKLSTKAEITKALTVAFAACDKSWAAVAPAWNTETVAFFGGTQTKLAILTFNTAHVFEHYGNVVTYMRLKGLVPPSSGGI